MRFIFKNENDFEVKWNNFVQKNMNVSHVYTLNALESQKHYARLPSNDEFSFLIEENDDVLAICPLVFQKNTENINSFSWSDYEGYIFSPSISEKLPIKIKRSLEKKCYEKIDELARDNQVSKIMLMLDPCTNLYDFNILTKYGYLDTTINTALLNLNKSYEEIWSGFRKSYKSIINKGLKRYTIEFYDSSNPSYEIHQNYKKMHIKTAGRQTRSDETWELQYKMLKEDNALIIGLLDNDKYVAFSYFYHHNKSAFYASAADDPDFKTKDPIQHPIMWSAVKYFKKRKFNVLDIGWQYFSPQLFSLPEEKDLKISFFKRGLCNEIRPVYRGIKYLNNDLLLKEISNNLNSLYEFNKK